VEQLRDALTNADSVGVPDLETLRGLVDAVKEAGGTKYDTIMAEQVIDLLT